MNTENPEFQETQAHHLNDELVAYLDGELNRDNASQVEDALSENSDYRLRLKQLQQAWDLLDELPRSTTEESFTRSTVELVVVSAESEAMATAVRWKTWRIGAWVVGCLAMCAAAWSGVLLVNHLGNQDNHRLLEDLPLVQEIDIYDPIDNMEFLKELDASGAFAEELDDDL